MQKHPKAKCGSHWDLSSLAVAVQIKETQLSCLSNWIHSHGVNSLTYFGGKLISTKRNSCHIHGHFPLATHNFLNRKTCSSVYLLASTGEYWPRIPAIYAGFENL